MSLISNDHDGDACALARDKWQEKLLESIDGVRLIDCVTAVRKHQTTTLMLRGGGGDEECKKLASPPEHAHK